MHETPPRESSCLRRVGGLLPKSAAFNKLAAPSSKGRGHRRTLTDRGIYPEESTMNKVEGPAGYVLPHLIVAGLDTRGLSSASPVPHSMQCGLFRNSWVPPQMIRALSCRSAGRYAPTSSRTAQTRTSVCLNFVSFNFVDFILMVISRTADTISISLGRPQVGRIRMAEKSRAACLPCPSCRCACASQHIHHH